MNSSNQESQDTHLASNNTLTYVQSTSNQFSKANAFGILLTLTLILLTQPFGSLLYEHVNSSLGKIIFLFWRINPLACFAEAAIICLVISRQTVQLVKSGHGPFFRSRHPQYGWLDLSHWTREFQLTAAALLLLRAKKRDRDGKFVAARLFEELQLDNVGSGETGEEAENLTVDQTSSIPSETLGSTSIEQQTSAPPENTFLPQAESATISAADSSQNHPASAEPVPGVIRKRTTMAEEATSSSAMSNQTPETKHIHAIKEALGSNAMSHAEAGIDLFTFISVVFIIIKLAVTTLPWHIRTYAACMVSGWLAVHLLLVLLHRNELNELDMENTIVRAWEIREQLYGKKDDRPLSVALILIFVPAPVYCYMSYLIFSESIQLSAWIIIPYYISCGAVAFVGFCYWPQIFLYIGLPFFVIGVMFGAPFLVFKFGGGISSAMILWALFVVPREMGDNENAVFQIVVLFLNYMTAIVPLTVMLVKYDATGTSQPGWVNFLG